MSTKKEKKCGVHHTLQTYHVDYDNFMDLADILLNKTLLKVNHKIFRICEIEFYYFSKAHPDAYTHCSDEQKMKCKFYFHKYKTGAYKSGTYKGMDITMSPDDVAYCGILIRSILDVDTDEFIEGPCCTVNTILRQYKFDNVSDFVAGKKLPLDIYDEEHKLFIVDTNNLKHERIYKGPRIGLSNKYPEYQNAKYRYAIMINRIKKKRKTFDRILTI